MAGSPWGRNLCRSLKVEGTLVLWRVKIDAVIFPACAGVFCDGDAEQTDVTDRAAGVATVARS